jgi:hypothetical protein
MSSIGILPCDSVFPRPICLGDSHWGTRQNRSDSMDCRADTAGKWKGKVSNRSNHFRHNNKNALKGSSQSQSERRTMLLILEVDSQPFLLLWRKWLTTSAAEHRHTLRNPSSEFRRVRTAQTRWTAEQTPSLSGSDPPELTRRIAQRVSMFRCRCRL